jgi:hypothetical protein
MMTDQDRCIAALKPDQMKKTQATLLHAHAYLVNRPLSILHFLMSTVRKRNLRHVRTQHGTRECVHSSCCGSASVHRNTLIVSRMDERHMGHTVLVLLSITAHAPHTH